MTAMAGSTSLELRVPPAHARLADLRRRVDEALAAAGVAAARRADVVLVLSELVTNAVDQGPDADIRVGVDTSDDGEVTLTVANRRTGAPLDEPRRWPVPEKLGERGRGLQIVGHLADHVVVDDVDGWTSVRCGWGPVS